MELFSLDMPINSHIKFNSYFQFYEKYYNYKGSLNFGKKSNKWIAKNSFLETCWNSILQPVVLDTYNS